MKTLDLDFERDFSPPGLAHRDVEFMIGWSARRRPEALEYLGPIGCILHACSAVLWGREIADVTNALLPCYEQVKSVEQAKLFELPPGGGVRLRGFVSPRKTDDFDYRVSASAHFELSSSFLASVYGLGGKENRLYGSGIVAVLPVETENIVWSAVQRGAIQKYFTNFEDLHSYSWIGDAASRSGSGARTFLGKLEGRRAVHGISASEAYFAAFPDDAEGTLTLTAQKV